MKTFTFLSFITTTLCAGGFVGEFQFHGGWAMPMNDLGTWVEPAPSYHTRLFLGTELNKGGISRAGYAIDFLFSSHEIKNEPQGYYNHLEGDFFFFPMGSPFFTFTPGISWVMNDVFAPEIGLDELSFRPGFILDFSMTLPITKEFSLNAKTRYDWVMEDKESPREGGVPINISGSFWNIQGGFSYHF